MADASKNILMHHQDDDCDCERSISFSNNGCNVTIVTSGRVSNMMSLFLSHLMKYDTIVVLDY